MAIIRQHGTITGTSSIEAHIVDAIGGGLCKKHGKYYGHGSHNIRDCPQCDIDEYFKRLKDNHGVNAE